MSETAADFDQIALGLVSQGTARQQVAIRNKLEEIADLYRGQIHELQARIVHLEEALRGYTTSRKE